MSVDSAQIFLDIFGIRTYDVSPNSRRSISNRELLPTPREMASSILY
jgi:hypothetical protein